MNNVKCLLTLVLSVVVVLGCVFIFGTRLAPSPMDVHGHSEIRIFPNKIVMKLCYPFRSIDKLLLKNPLWVDHQYAEYHGL